METPFLKIKKLHPKAILPSKRDEDAGYDVYAIFEKEAEFLYPGDIKLMPLGISTEFPRDWVFYITERSGSGTKGLSTRAGVIDSGYRGEIKTPLNNTSNKLIILTNLSFEEVQEKYSKELEGFSQDSITLYPQTKAIAQGMLIYAPHVEVIEVEELGESVRGEGGWGSSGK